MESWRDIKGITDARHRYETADSAIAEFEEAIHELKSLRRAALVEITAADPDPPVEGRRRSDVDPVAVILRAWNSVDRAMAKALVSHGMPYDAENTATNVHAVLRRGLLANSVVRDLIALRNLRNNVIHSGMVVTSSDGDAATVTAASLVAALRGATAGL